MSQMKRVFLVLTVLVCYYRTEGEMFELLTIKYETVLINTELY